MDVKKTLMNLHKRFPNFDLDTLLLIVDCYVELWSYSYTTANNAITAANTATPKNQLY
jgi:hypothetical protein